MTLGEVVRKIGAPVALGLALTCSNTAAAQNITPVYHQVPSEYTSCITSILDSYGRKMFTQQNAHELNIFKYSCEDIKELSSYKGGGRTLFHYNDIITMISHRIPMKDIRSLMTITDENQNPVFDRGSKIREFSYLNNGDAQHAEKIGKVYKKFNYKDFIALNKYKVPAHFIRKTALEFEKRKKHNIITGAVLATMYNLGISVDRVTTQTFRETGKPNLLLTYPIVDGNGAFAQDAERKFLKTLESGYDVMIRFVATDKDVWKARRDGTKNSLLDAIVLSCHGVPHSCSLSDRLTEMPTTRWNDSKRVDLTDTRLRDYLISGLTPKGTLYLNSCSTAKGGRGANNLANFFIRGAKGRKIIASLVDFDQKNVSIRSLYPLRLTIRSFSGRDKTYTN